MIVEALLAGAVVCGLLGCLWAVLRVRRGVPVRDAVAEALMVAGTAPWLGPLLVPNSHALPVHRVYLVPFVDLLGQAGQGPRFLAVQLGGNLALFAVLGFFMPIRYRVGLLAVAGVAAACSTGVEVVQYVFDLHRVSSIDDVMVNTLGGVLGALASHRWWRTISPGERVPCASATRG